MKTIITFITAILTLSTAIAQDYYKNGALFKVNDDLTLKYIVFQGATSRINIFSTEAFSYQFDVRIDRPSVTLKDYSILKRALEETFSPEELQKYKDVEMGIHIICNGQLKPVDAMFSIRNEAPDYTIPPLKFAMLRQKLIDYAEFVTQSKNLCTDQYYTWSESIVVPLSYYLQSNN